MPTRWMGDASIGTVESKKCRCLLDSAMERILSTAELSGITA